MMEIIAKGKINSALALARQVLDLPSIAQEERKKVEILGIIETLEAAIRALERGIDDDGSPITPTMIGAGLNRMLEYMILHAIWFMLHANVSGDIKKCLDVLKDEIKSVADFFESQGESSMKKVNIAGRLRAVAPRCGRLASLAGNIATGIETGVDAHGMVSKRKEEVAALTLLARVLESMGKPSEAAEICFIAEAIKRLGEDEEQERAAMNAMNEIVPRREVSGERANTHGHQVDLTHRQTLNLTAKDVAIPVGIDIQWPNVCMACGATKGLTRPRATRKDLEQAWICLTCETRQKRSEIYAVLCGIAFLLIFFFGTVGVHSFWLDKQINTWYLSWGASAALGFFVAFVVWVVAAVLPIFRYDPYPPMYELQGHYIYKFLTEEAAERFRSVNEGENLRAEFQHAEKIKCPNCGEINSKDAMVCWKCNISLSIKPTSTTDVGSSKDIDWKCDECGQPLITDSKYAGAKVECPKCKKLLIIPNSETSREIQEKFVPDAEKKIPDEIAKQETSKSFTEKDNHGTRHDRESIASVYWAQRISSIKKDPFVLYKFNSEKDARDALLELPCIHVAEDSGKLICTEVLIFGYYTTANGERHAVVCGGDLTHELWEQAKASFIKHGGRPKGQGDLEPQKIAAPRQTGKVPQVGKVVFVREDRQNKLGATMIYRIHKGHDAASAKAFLEQNPVTQKFYYIIVETPEGNYARDMDGIYKE